MKSNKNESTEMRIGDAVAAAAAATRSRSKVTMQETHIPLLMNQLTPWAQNNSGELDRTDFVDAKGSAGFSFMSDACLPHMSDEEKQLGYQVIDRWIDFAWGQEEGEIVDA